MPIKLIAFLLIIAFAHGCQSSGQSDTQKSVRANITGPHFQFSLAGMVQDSRDPGNWCTAGFPEAVLINADPNDAKRRYFSMEDGVYKVSVELGNVLAAYILRKSGEQVNICTSNQFPQCLSKYANFTVAADGQSFRYNNGKAIDFTTMLQVNGSSAKIILDFATDTQFGISVRKCDGCK
jgi:hypothetical protein